MARSGIDGAGHWAAAVVVDPACPHPGSTRTGSVAAHALAPADRVAAGHPGAALTPRVPAPPRPVDLGETRVARSPQAPGCRARARHDRPGDDRCADIQLAPFDVEVRAYARKQPGCRALVAQVYGIGELTSVTILAEVGDARRFRKLPQRGPLLRAGHHRVSVRRATRSGAPVAPRPAGVALGAL